MPNKKYYTVNPTWFHGYHKDPASQTVIFGEDTDKAETDSCLAICWYPTGPQLIADFDEWSLLTKAKSSLTGLGFMDLLAQEAQKRGKDLLIEHVTRILEVCGFEEEKCIPNPGRKES